MLKIEIKEDRCKIEVGGTLLHLSAEMLMAINNVYKAIEEVNEGCAETFKDVVTNNVEVAFMDEKELKKALDAGSESKEELIETLKAVLDELEEEDS